MDIKRKVRYGMIGGGPGAFVGAIHRKATAMDGRIELVAGSFSSSPQKSYQTGNELFLDRDRIYSSYEEMLDRESKLPPDKKLDFISIVTPNYLHFPIAKAFLEEGFNIVCDKPMVVSTGEADELCKLTKKKGALFAVTYNYTGYPLVKQARELVRKGVLGKLQRIIVEYSGDFLLKAVEFEKKTEKEIWRMIPDKAGRSFCIGDIGTHAENLANYITGLEMERLNVMINTYIPGMELDDEASMLIKYKDGVRGVLFSSTVAAGEKNNLNIKIFGNKASLQWFEAEPNNLILRFIEGPEKTYLCGSDYLEPIADYNIRFPAGQPEGYVEAFANIYLHVANTILTREEEKEPHEFDLDFPTVIDGARGVYFINKAVDSGESEEWVDMSFNPDAYI